MQFWHNSQIAVTFQIYRTRGQWIQNLTVKACDSCTIGHEASGYKTLLSRPVIVVLYTLLFHVLFVTFFYCYSILGVLSGSYSLLQLVESLG